MLGEKKRISVVVPVVSTKGNDAIRNMLSRHLSSGFETVLANVKYGGMESTGGRAAAIALPYIIQEILRAADEGCDAVISFCFSDPGVPEARALVSIPVIGPGESSLHLACMLGYRVGIIELCGTHMTQLHGKGSNWARQIVKRHGLSDRVVSVRSVSLVMEDLGDREATSDALYKASMEAVEEDGAEVLVLACTGIIENAMELQKKLNVPVIQPGVAALKVAELLVSMNLKQSSLAYPSELDRGMKLEIKYPPALEECKS